MGADPKGRSSPTSEAPGHDPIDFFGAEASATTPSRSEKGLQTAAARVAAEPLVLINAQPGDALDLFTAEPDDSSPPDAAAADPLTLFSTEAAPPPPRQTAARPAPRSDRDADAGSAELRIRATPERPPVPMPLVAKRRADARRVAVAVFVLSLLAVTAVGIAFLVRATTRSTAPPPSTATRIDPPPAAIGTIRPSAPNAPVEGTVPRAAAPDSPRATPPTAPAPSGTPSPRSAEARPPTPPDTRAANPADARRPDPLSIQRRDVTPPTNSASVTGARATRDAAPAPTAPSTPSSSPPPPGTAPLTPPVAPAGTGAAPVTPSVAVPVPIAPPPAEPAPAVAATPEPPAAAPTATLPPVRDDRAAPAATPAPRVNDSDAIQTALDRYRTAFNVLDARAAGAVWPTVDQRALARAFERLERQNLEFANCAIDTRGLRATATCTGTAEYVPKVGTRTTRIDDRQWMFVLRKVDQQWLIDAVNSR